jgi:hypothetical protein
MTVFFRSYAQRPDRCGSMDLLQQKFKEHPALKARFEAREKQLRQMVAERVQAGNTGNLRDQALLTVPVIFHIVLTNPSAVTDAQIKAQMDTLNKDYAGINGDTVHILSAFKSRFGVANIQFALATQTPDGEPTTGIERYITTQSDFSVFSTNVKHVSSGGADAWNTDNYLNIWICQLSGGYLGLGTFPNDGDSANQGLMIDYRSIPGGSYTNYNGGKTLTHEIGHYFNLYHTWGDDGGACTGTDYVNDTPNQADYTSGCPSGEKTDACSPVSPGVLYQDYMDYSYDNCLVMFTTEQAARMQAAVSTYRTALFTSPGLQAPVVKAYDARLKAIAKPVGRVCTGSFSPVVTIRNVGSTTLTSLTINVSIDGSFIAAYSWTGSLASLADASVTLSSITSTAGNHVLQAYTSNPNGQADQRTTNDTLSAAYMYFPPASLPLAEHFEGSSFPPDGWDIINPDGSYTWEKANGTGKTGNAAMIKNYYYSSYGARDYLRLPLVDLSNADSAFISFQVAAATYTNPGTAGNVWDTLQVVISTDCGNTYTPLYKKWADSLVTAPAGSNFFVPTATQWRKDSVNLTPYIGQGNVMLAFLNTTENENNIYLDDITVYKKTVNPNLKAKGFIVTPNPASQSVAVQFYPQPSNLRDIAIYSFAGQKVAEVRVGDGQAMNYYTFNIGRLAAGVYVVRAVFTDKVVTQKLVKIQ